MHYGMVSLHVYNTYFVLCVSILYLSGDTVVVCLQKLQSDITFSKIGR